MSPLLAIRSPAWDAAGWTMLHLAWIGAVVGLLASLARRLARDARPEARHALALVFLAGLGLAPAAIFARVYEPAKVPSPAPAASSTGARGGLASLSMSPERSPDPAASRPLLAVDRRDERIAPSRLEAVVACLPAFWLAGSALTLGWLAAGLVGVERLRRSSRVLAEGDVFRCSRRLADALGVARRFGVAVCDRLAGPILIGVVRPLILLPPAALSGWSPEQIEMVLLHELAHLRRRDNLVNLAQRLVESLLFFHPVTWWLSGWLRLERELCCDRFVVEHLARSDAPRAYAELLLLLAGSGGGRRGVATAMAGRCVPARIRRILNVEDRPMKLTMPEGVGLIGALLVGASLVAGSSAAAPKKEPDEAVRQALRRAAEDAAALPPDAEGPEESREIALLGVAEAQLKLGDRDAGLATFDRALGSLLAQLDSGKHGLEVMDCLGYIVQIQRQGGEPDAARRSLERITRAVRTLEPVPARQEVVQITGVAEQRRREFEVGRLAVSALLAELAKEHVALGRRDEARPLFRRAVAVIEPETSVMKPMVLSGIGTALFQQGDAAEGRALLEQARREAEKLGDVDDRNGALPYVAQALAQTGRLDGALEVIKRLDGRWRASAFEKLPEAMSEDASRRRGAWFDAGGIKILVGAEWLAPKDPAEARDVPPRIAEAARTLGDPVLAARVLSIIAGMQARGGDLSAALATADTIPSLGARDHRTPPDGFYEAIKPATLAIVAGVAAGRKEEAAAREGFRKALAAAREVESEGERIVAQIVIAREFAGHGEMEAARGLALKTVPLARAQPEPRRSRGLAMLAECQAKAGDLAGAAATMEAIRDYPGLEKSRALTALADAQEAAGDRAAAHAMLRRALACVEAPRPERPAMGKEGRLLAIAARTLVDLDIELGARWLDYSRETSAVTLRARLGDVEEALRRVREKPEDQRGNLLSVLCGQLVRQGEVERALGLAASLKNPRERLAAVEATAVAAGDKDGDARR